MTFKGSARRGCDAIEKFLTLAATLARFPNRLFSGEKICDFDPYRIFGAGDGTSIELAIPDLALPEGPTGPFLLPAIPRLPPLM
jgi:hypothetical protein